MSTKRGILKGRKFNGNHSTLTTAGVGVVRFLKDREEVTKIVIGPISPIRPALSRLKVGRVPAGLRIAVRGTNSQQLFYAYTDEPDRTEQALTGYWEEQTK